MNTCDFCAFLRSGGRLTISSSDLRGTATLTIEGGDEALRHASAHVCYGALIFVFYAAAELAAGDWHVGIEDGRMAPSGSLIPGALDVVIEFPYSPENRDAALRALSECVQALTPSQGG